MKKILLLLTTIILVSGCKGTQTFAEKESRCVAYKETIRGQVKYENSITKNPSPSHECVFELEEVFFSNKLDTCVYVEGHGLFDGPVDVAVDYVVKDFYNNKELKTFTIKTNREFTGKLAEFEQYIEGIKG